MANTVHEIISKGELFFHVSSFLATKIYEFISDDYGDEKGATIHGGEKVAMSYKNPEFMSY